MMKKFVLVLALTLVFVCCASFSVCAAPLTSSTVVITNGSSSKSFTVTRQVNNYPLQTNSPIYTYEPWYYAISSSVYSFGPGTHYGFQFNHIWDVTVQESKGDALAFNIGVMVLPNVAKNSFPAMTARLFDLQAIVDNVAYDLEIKEAYSVTFDIPNISTTSSFTGSQVQYVCYSCVLPLPEAASFSLGISCNLSVYIWPDWPIQSLFLCVSDKPLQFSSFDSSTDEWANVFQQFLTPEKLKESEENAEKGENAGQGAQDAVNTDVMGGDYGSAAQTGYTDIVKPLLNNPLISVALPIGVVFILLLWGIHKGNS